MVFDKTIYWVALSVAVLANITANTALKIAVGSITQGSFRDKLLHFFAQGSFWLGCASALLLLVSYLIAIRGVPLSSAYPIVTTLALVGLILVDKFLFGSAISSTKIIGIGLIMVGVGFVSVGT